jgi:hypothetical protein
LAANVAPSWNGMRTFLKRGFVSTRDSVSFFLKIGECQIEIFWISITVHVSNRICS